MVTTAYDTAWRIWVKGVFYGKMLFNLRDLIAHLQIQLGHAIIKNNAVKCCVPWQHGYTDRMLCQKAEHFRISGQKEFALATAKEAEEFEL